MSDTSDVTVIGLGPMGLALTRHLLASGRRVTVWNRTAARAAAAVDRGATLAASADAALRASPIVFVCVANYAASHAALDGAAAALRGRLLVQLSTGTPADARAEASWAEGHGAAYLDGAIMATPDQMGRPDTTIFLSGSAAAFARAEPALRATAGGLAYMGPSVGHAATWDLATLSCLFAAMFGFVHGARICEAEGLPVGDFAAMITQLAPVMGEMLGQVGRDIATETYQQPDASVETCANTGRLLVRHADEASVDARFPTFADGLFRTAIAAGFADQRFASFIKVLREPAR
jgi:3-hydroxyisobutyrate dehydrogenase-like beta-hydroxyacid dehydrogenase